MYVVVVSPRGEMILYIDVWAAQICYDVVDVHGDKGFDNTQGKFTRNPSDALRLSSQRT